MVGQKALAMRSQSRTELDNLFRQSVAIQKLKEGARYVFVSDKNGTIQKFSAPVEEPPEGEVRAGHEFRRRLERHLFIECSAQVIELSIDARAYWLSRKMGLSRGQPRILLPNGTYTNDPAEVRGWEYLNNPDVFLGFGSGNYYAHEGAYFTDLEYEQLLGGKRWRPQALHRLNSWYKGSRYREFFSKVDKGHGDVDELDSRIEFKHANKKEAEFLRLGISHMQVRGFDAVWVDESEPGRLYTTYMTPQYAQKPFMLARCCNTLSYYSGIPREELKLIYVGDQGHDAEAAIKTGALFIVPGGSPLVERIETNGTSTDDDWGYALPGGPQDPDPDYRGFYWPTKVPGVYQWRGPHHKEVEVILAERTEWARGLDCTESVLACIDHLGFK